MYIDYCLSQNVWFRFRDPSDDLALSEEVSRKN